MTPKETKLLVLARCIEVYQPNCFTPELANLHAIFLDMIKDYVNEEPQQLEGMDGDNGVSKDTVPQCLVMGPDPLIDILCQIKRELKIGD